MKANDMLTPDTLNKALKLSHDTCAHSKWQRFLLISLTSLWHQLKTSTEDSAHGGNAANLKDRKSESDSDNDGGPRPKGARALSLLLRSNADILIAESGGT